MPIIQGEIMPTITANGAEFYYELQGQGPALILIAGYTCDHFIWQPIVEELSKHFQVLTFDNRAVGQTQDDAPVLTAELMAEDVMALAQELGLKKPHIVGQSMGGNIAQVVASRYASEINKLVILTSTAKWREAMLKAMQSLLLMRAKDIDFDVIFEVLLPWIFGEKTLKNSENIQNLKQLLLANPYPQSLENQSRQVKVLEAFDGRKYLNTIQAPTLVVHGLQDVVALQHESKYLADNIANADFTIVDGPHGIVAEIPDEIARAIINFCKD